MRCGKGASNSRLSMLEIWRTNTEMYQGRKEQALIRKDDGQKQALEVRWMKMSVGQPIDRAVDGQTVSSEISISIGFEKHAPRRR